MIAAWQALQRRSPVLTAVAVIHLALALVLIVAMQIDAVIVLGIERWIKPLKFAVSIAIYLGTLAWLQPSLDLPARTRSYVIGVAAGTMTLEMIAIGMQAFRGTTSHFNIATVFDGIVFQVMGVAILANTIAAAWMAVASWRLFKIDRSGYQLGVVLGFALFLFGSVIGGVLIGYDAHTVGAADGGAGLPLLNWSTTAGDLRVSHFVALHALQGLPLLGGWLGTKPVVLAAVAWGVATVVLLVRAFAGRPLIARI